MPRWNYVARQRNTEDKKSSTEILQERINQFLDVVMENKEISDYNLQQKLGWGVGIYERISRIIRYEHHEEANWDKKSRKWAYISVMRN